MMVRIGIPDARAEAEPCFFAHRQPLPVRRVMNMSHVIHDIGIASQIGAYSDAIELRPNLRWLMASGTPGLSQTGDLPNNISGQAGLAWKHVVHMLQHASMTVADIVKVTQYMTRGRHQSICRGFARASSATIGQLQCCRLFPSWYGRRFWSKSRL